VRLCQQSFALEYQSVHALHLEVDT
jgi:hypothetical protein